MLADVVKTIRSRTRPEVWHKGLRLADDGAVTVEDCNSTRWAFTVEDGRSYKVLWAWGSWLCACGRVESPCAHVVAAGLVLETAAAVLHQAALLRRITKRSSYRLRSEGWALFLSVVQRDGDLDGRIRESVVSGDPESSDPVVAAIPAGASEVRVGPLLGSVLAPALARANDVQLDGRPVFVASEIWTVSWIALARDPSPPVRFPVVPDSGRSEFFFDSACVLTDGALRFVRYEARPLMTLTETTAKLFALLADVVTEHLPDFDLRPLMESLCGGRLPLLPTGGEPPRSHALPEPAPSTARPAPPPPPALPPTGGPVLRAPSPTPTRPSSTGGLAPRDPPPTPTRPTLSPQWKATGTDYDVTFTARGPRGEHIEVPSTQVLPAWRAGAPSIATRSGDLAWLPSDWLERYGPILERLHAARDRDGKLQRWGRPVAATLCQALKVVPPPELAGLAALADDFSGIPAAKLPSGLRVELREYQRRGVDWLCLLRDAELGALLADDMGLGKTVQTICALRGRALIVAPTSTLHNWVAELKRFRPRLRVCLYHGASRRLDPKAAVTVTSYAVLRQDKKELCEPEWDIAVLDEAQAIKEPRTITAGAAFALKARWRLALTGTPVENRLSELWSVCHFLNPGLLGAGKDFISAYARPVEAGSSPVIAELQAKLRPFILRRRKSDVARELPPRTDIVLTCQLDEHERRVYDALRAAAHADVVKHLTAGGDVLAALELLLRLRQAACHVGLIPGQTATRSSKLDLLLEHLVDITAQGHRALVFSQWTSLLDRLEPMLRANNLAFDRLDGKTQDREAVVARFQAASGPPLLLLSLKAGGVGLNLTAADHVYLLDPWWNPAVEDQAADRTHRIGQSRPVFIHRLVAEDTVEERILELHQRKRALAVTAVDGAQAPGLTREDLLALLE